MTISQYKAKNKLKFPYLFYGQDIKFQLAEIYLSAYIYRSQNCTAILLVTISYTYTCIMTKYHLSRMPLPDIESGRGTIAILPAAGCITR